MTRVVFSKNNGIGGEMPDGALFGQLCEDACRNGAEYFHAAELPGQCSGWRFHCFQFRDQKTDLLDLCVALLIFPCFDKSIE